MTIRVASQADADCFPAIERSAGTLFALLPDLAWIASAPDRSAAQYRDLVSQRLSWCAVTRAGRPVGFLSAGREDREIHVWELAVHRSRQNQGIGQALLAAAVARAKTIGFAAMTLTTFLDVPWNAPFYRQRGFAVLSGTDLSPRLRRLLDDEGAQGLPVDRRCAMRLSLPASDTGGIGT